MKWRWYFAVLCAVALMFAVSCGGDDDDNDGGDNGGDDDDVSGDDDIQDAGNTCEDNPTTIADPETVSELLGISAADIFDLTGEGFVVQASYAEDTSVLTQSPLGGSSDLTVSITYDGGEIRAVESVPVETDMDIAGDCRDRMEVDVTIGFSTADGAFNETWDAVLAMRVNGTGDGFDDPTLDAEFDPMAVSGDFSIESFEGPTPDSVTASMTTTAAGAIAGEVDIYVEQSEGSGDEGTVSQTVHAALSWGADEE